MRRAQAIGINMRHLLRLSLAAAGLAVTATSPLSAATLITNDRGEWLTGVSGIITLNLDTFSSGASGGFTVGNTVQPGNMAFYNNMNGYFNNNFQVVGMQNSNYYLGQTLANATQTWNNWGSGAILLSDTKTSTNTVSMRVTFRTGGVATPVNAFGFALGLGGDGGGAGTITVTPQGLAAQSVSTLSIGSGLRFFGVTSDTQTFGFADITITTPNRYIVLDTLEQGVFTNSTPPPAATETPDAATLLCVGTGLACLGFLRRNRAATAA
jgi:hypothetical protein